MKQVIGLRIGKPSDSNIILNGKTSCQFVRFNMSMEVCIQYNINVGTVQFPHVIHGIICDIIAGKQGGNIPERKKFRIQCSIEI